MNINLFKRYKTVVLTTVVLVLHAVGLYFFLSEDLRNQLLPFTPFHLFITTAILWLSFLDFSLKFLGYSILVYVVGMTAEIIGVNTGLLFGDYEYLEMLGMKFFGVPYVIGLNWLMLLLSAGTVVAYLRSSWVVKATLAALLMVGLDVLIEQVSPDLSFWQFRGKIPLWNYVSWFIISFPLMCVGFKWNLINKNLVGVSVYLILMVFFLSLILGL